MVLTHAVQETPLCGDPSSNERSEYQAQAVVPPPLVDRLPCPHTCLNEMIPIRELEETPVIGEHRQKESPERRPDSLTDTHTVRCSQIYLNQHNLTHLLQDEMEQSSTVPLLPVNTLRPLQDRSLIYRTRSFSVAIRSLSLFLRYQHRTWKPASSLFMLCVWRSTDISTVAARRLSESTTNGTSTEHPCERPLRAVWRLWVNSAL